MGASRSRRQGSTGAGPKRRDEQQGEARGQDHGQRRPGAGRNAYEPSGRLGRLPVQAASNPVQSRESAAGPGRHYSARAAGTQSMRTAVIVIGDLGRSPRMQYHAASLAAAGSDVDLIGLEGAAVMPAVDSESAHSLCIACPIAPSPAAARAACAASSSARPRAASARRCGSSRVLMRIPKPDVILVQNPPAFPTLFVAWLASRLRGARFVIDWHNLSHTIAAVKVGEHHRAVKAIARSERRWAKRADAHLTVSKALAEWLARHYKREGHRRLRSPGAMLSRARSPPMRRRCGRSSRRTLSSAASRPPIVVCPTSWTPGRGFRSAARSARARRAAADAQRRR